MKGLLTKDFSITMKRKSYILLITAISMLLMLTGQSNAFVVGYLTSIAVVLCINTISNDKNDNSMAFFMTFPVSKREYVLSKYIMAGCGTACSWVIGCIMELVYACIKGNLVGFASDIYGLLLIIFLGAVFGAIFIPIYLKFDNEQIKMIMLIIFGGIALISVAAAVLIDFLEKIVPFNTMELHFNLSEAAVLALILLIIAIMVIIS